MSSATEEHARELKSELSLLATHASYQRGTLEVLPDKLIAHLPDVFLEITGAAYEQFMQKRMPSHLPLEQDYLQKMQFSFPLLLPAVNARSLLSMQGSDEFSIITNIEIRQDLSFLKPLGSRSSSSRRI